MYSAEARRNAFAFQPRTSDVVTLTTPKVGQTWLMATLRKITLGKGVRSDDPRLATSQGGIANAIPWLENKAFLGVLDHDQPGTCVPLAATCNQAASLCGPNQVVSACLSLT